MKKRTYAILLSTFLVFATISFVSAGFFDFLKPDLAPVDIEVTIGTGDAPSVFNISGINNVNLGFGDPALPVLTAISGFTRVAAETLAAEKTGATFLIEVSDANGVDNLPNTYDNAVTLRDFNSIDAPIISSSCEKITISNGHNADQVSPQADRPGFANYSCQIDMFWYNLPGSIGSLDPWDIDVNIQDLQLTDATQEYRTAGASLDKFNVLSNEGFIATANDLTGGLTFPVLSQGQTNQRSNNHPIILTNIGNTDPATFTVEGKDLAPPVGIQRIFSERFGVGFTNDVGPAGECDFANTDTTQLAVDGGASSPVNLHTLTTFSMPRGDFINTPSLVENAFVCLTLVDADLLPEIYKAELGNAWVFDLVVL